MVRPAESQGRMNRFLREELLTAGCNELHTYEH